MKSRLYALLLVMMMVGVSGGALADDKPTTGHPIKNVSWEELQGRCSDPNNWPDLQGVVPSNIQFECTNVERTWVPSEPGVIPLSSDRAVAAAVSATKFTVSNESRAINVPATSLTCPKFKEVTRTSSIVVPVSCGQVLGWKGKPVEFCQSIFDSGKGTGPKETVTRETGRFVDTCFATGNNPKPLE